MVTQVKLNYVKTLDEDDVVLLSVLDTTLTLPTQVRPQEEKNLIIARFCYDIT